ncbi:hypothetical protein [Bdellovibrio sp. HCB337]|uniref:hypothetical protein n=1 Tax=Bdellovibrio sp. HCB337 TaxID=3394358 RepID=UPI0039A78824
MLKTLPVLIFMMALQTHAAPKFNCTAEVFESLSDGSVRTKKVPLKVENESVTRITLSADLDGRGFTFSGEKEGPYFVTISEEPDYTKGSMTTANFSKEGRLQLSVVNQSLVHKLECFKN